LTAAVTAETGADELVLCLCPVLAFVLPELIDGAIAGVIKENTVGKAADWRHEVFLGSGRDVVHIELHEGLIGAEEGSLGDGCALGKNGGPTQCSFLVWPALAGDNDVAVEIDRFPEVVALACPEIGLNVPIGRLSGSCRHNASL